MTRVKCIESYESDSFLYDFLNQIDNGYIPLILNSNITKEERSSIEVNISSIDERFIHGKYFILCTSGTTGYTKLVVHSYDSLEKTGRQFAKILDATGDDIFFSASKMFHAYGLGNSFSIPNSCGASTIFCDKLITPKLACDVINQNAVTVFCGVPRHYASMVNTKTYPSSKSLRLCLSAGEKLPLNIKHEFERNTGVKIIDAVGSTETLGFMLSSGKKIKDVDIKLINDELFVKSDSMFLGYYNEPSNNLENGWFKTGDLYEVNDEVYTHRGRVNDLIKINGNKVYANTIEHEVLELDGVKECAVVKYKNSFELDKIKLCIVCDNYDKIKLQVLSISKKYRIPFLIELKNELPRTATGKIRKYELC
jgi:acyl-coenzyme A synthetase/AMP-(fatty) acid ligase